jgi:hypothetical protein
MAFRAWDSFCGRSVLAFRFATLLSPPKPATAYAQALCGIVGPIDDKREKRKRYLFRFSDRMDYNSYCQIEVRTYLLNANHA